MTVSLILTRARAVSHASVFGKNAILPPCYPFLVISIRLLANLLIYILRKHENFLRDPYVFQITKETGDDWG